MRLASMNVFILCIISYIQIYRHPVVWCNRHVAEFFKTSVLHPLFPQMLLIPKVQNKASTFKMLLKKFIADSVVLLFQCVNALDFTL